MKVSLIKMFWVFFKIGAITIGGGLVMIGVMKKEFVDNEKWLTEEEAVDIFAVSQSLPGVIAINSSMFLGYRLRGIPGVIVSGIAVILSPIIVITMIAFIFENFIDNIYVAKAFLGIKAGMAALFLSAIISFSKNIIKNIFSIVIAILAFIAIFIFKLDIVYIMFSGLIIGLIFGIFANPKNGGENDVT